MTFDEMCPNSLGDGHFYNEMQLGSTTWFIQRCCPINHEAKEP